MMPRPYRLFFRATCLLLLAVFAAPVLAQGAYATFIKKFDSAKELGDRKRMIRALKDSPQMAIEHFSLLVDTYVTRGDAKAGERILLFKELWKESFGSSCLEKIERFRAEIGDSERQALFQIIKNYRKAQGLYQQGVSQKQPETQFNAAKAMIQLAEQSEQIGDRVLASRCLRDAAAYLAQIRPVKKEYKEMERDALRQYRTLHQELDWTQGLDFKRNMIYLKSLEHQLKQGQIGGGAAKKKKNEEGPAKYLPGSKWQDFDMLISLQKKPQPGICLPSSVNPLEWRGVWLEGKLPSQISFFQDGKIWLKRLGANDYRYGVSEADAGKYKLAMASKPSQCYLKYEKGGYEVEYGFFTYLPTDREVANGTMLNYGPTWGQRTSASLFFRSASILYAEIEGEKFEFLDENANGVVGEAWNSTPGTGDFRFGSGWEQAVGVPVFDSMKRGRSKHRLPFSSYVKVGDHWMRLRVTGNNETLRYRPLDPASVQSGFVQVKWEGPRKAKPDYLVLAEIGYYKGAAFDAFENGKKPVEVPAGRYAIIYGRILNGKFPRNMDALILPGTSKPFDVEPGKTTEIRIGAPFHIEYQSEVKNGEVSVDSSTFYVKDSYGLRYGAIGAALLEPELIVSKKKGAKSGKVIGSWRAVQGNEIGPLSMNVGKRRQAKGLRGGVPAYHLSYWPINGADSRNADSLLRVKIPFRGTVFVAVRQKKHKLFGKLEPIWK
ncbi:MAG: hypothetical protein CSA62_10450 [Planctomycetota bacterium]|nr:MAG: hypothetical protein CSA62_10450 [Planctomycetota bacterium]